MERHREGFPVCSFAYMHLCFVGRFAKHVSYISHIPVIDAPPTVVSSFNLQCRLNGESNRIDLHTIVMVKDDSFGDWRIENEAPNQHGEFINHRPRQYLRMPWVQLAWAFRGIKHDALPRGL